MIAVFLDYSSNLIFLFKNIQIYVRFLSTSNISNVFGRFVAFYNVVFPLTTIIMIISLNRNKISIEILYYRWPKY